MLAGLIMDWNALTAAQMRKRLAAAGATQPLTCTPTCSQGLRQAGVLAPLIRIDGRWHVLFIRRSRWEGDRHSGQVAFPGGKREACDADLRATAVRETVEELGLAPDCLQLIGSLAPRHSRTGYCITAQIALLDWPCPLTPDAREVARVFSLPLDWLADRSNWRVVPCRDTEGQPAEVIRYREQEGEQLWGVTAALVQQLLGRLATD